MMMALTRRLNNLRLDVQLFKVSQFSRQTDRGCTRCLLTIQSHACKPKLGKYYGEQEAQVSL